MQSVMCTSWEEIAEISKRRGKDFDAAKYAPHCTECGAPASMFGIMHWVDCMANEEAIRFVKK